MKKYWYLIPVILFSFIAFCVAATNKKASPPTQDISSSISSSHLDDVTATDVSQYNVSCTTISGCQTLLINLGYNVGPKGADGIYGPATYTAMDKCYKDHKCLYPAWSLSPNYTAPYSLTYDTGYSNGDWANTCPNGSCYGAISPSDGTPRTHYVRGYDRADGTHVGGYYRGHK